MGEHERNRDKCCIWYEKECEDSIAEDILEAWSPTLGEHFFEYGYESRCYNRSEFWARIIEHVERYRELCI